MSKISTKHSGILTPIRAQDTGLVPEQWKVEKDELEGEVILAELNFDYCPVLDDEHLINGDTLLQRADEANVIGSLGLAAELIRAQDEGREIFPIESRDKHHFSMPRTILRSSHGGRHVPDFTWCRSGWILCFRGLDSGLSSCCRLLRARE